MFDKLRERWRNAWRAALRTHGVAYAGDADDAALVTQRLWQDAENRLPLLAHLSASERADLRQLALKFVAQKEWYGAHEFALDDEVRLTIALQACLLILKLDLDWYREWVGIVVYPGDFVVPRRMVDAAGVVHEYEDTLLGEAWSNGPVLLSWHDDVADSHVVLHEFAHKLDMLNGPADGLPPLHAGMSRTDWSAAFTAAFADFCRQVEAAEYHGGARPALDPYGAESPAEFFAVMSEAFFATPQLLQQAYPQVYQQLRLFYLQDPAARS
jgi:Mlc titration factor MtfA (ptsG expression regulator)